MRLDPMATTEPPGTIVLVTVNHGGWAHCGEMSHLSGHPFPVQVPADGDISIAEIKSRIALALPGVPPEQQLLEWNGKPLGRVDAEDTVDESLCTLADVGVLRWTANFPEWGLTLRLLPPAPKDPAVAIKGLDPEEEVAKARADGTLYHIDTWDEHQARYKVDAD